MKVSKDSFIFLKKTGHKLTTPRREILNVLTSIPVSAQEIFEILRQKKVKTDIVTVYRTLELFTELGFIREANFGDKTARYELILNKDHHHHLICQSCGSVEDIPLDEKVIVKQLQKKSRFKVERHSLEFFGFCSNCQN